MSDKELEEQLSEAGARLSEPPSSVEDLLNLLDEIENCLSKVEQSPATSMQHALSPSLKALVANKLLKHSDVDVKVAVAACVSEITRITAPEAPYNDEEMKEIFQLIVESFEKLYDTSSRSYGKRVSILETVAKVRSCVVMLDLECDGLILEMFNHFLKAIRDFHSENIFSSMETIMSLVLEESEEISAELLSPLLTSVKKENQDALPIAQKLAEKVLQNCTTKLTPCLKQVLKSIGTSPNEYSRIVATICQENSEAVENNDDNLSGEHMTINSKPPENTSFDKPQQEDEEMEPAASCPGEVEPSIAQEDEEMEPATKKVLSNGDIQMENVGSSLGVESPQENEESNHLAAQTQPSDAEPDSLDSNVAQTETKADQTTKKKRGRKPSSAAQIVEASARSPIDGDRGNGDLPDQSTPGKIADNTLAEGETLSQVSSPSPSRDDPVKVASQPPSQSVPDGARSKKGRIAGTNKRVVNEDIDLESNLAQNELGGPSTDAIAKKEHEGSSEIDGKPQRRSSKRPQSVKGGEEDVAPTKDYAVVTSDSDSKPVKRLGKKVVPVKDKNETKEHEGSSEIDGKPQRRSSKRPQSVKGGEEDVAPTKDAVVTSDSDSKPVKRLGKKVPVKDKNETKEDAAPTKDASASSDSDTKPLKQSGKKLTVKDKDGNKGESSEKKLGGKGKKGKGTPIAKSDTPEEPSNRKTGSSSKSTAKATPKGQKQMEETPKTTAKRKRTAEKDEETQEFEEFGENLVGSKIKVWWPDDAMFYEGVVDSFDPIKKKHKVLYVDGDEEILLLKEERWVFLDTTKSEEQADLPSPDASESNRKKKAKKTPDSSSKQTNTDTALKRGKGASTSKSKDEGTKSKSKEDGEGDGKTTETASKSKNNSVGKSKTDTPKTSSKTKVDQKKTASDSKDTPKTGSKSKGDTSKSGSKSKAGAKSKDDTPKAGSKTKEDDTPKANNKLKSVTSKAGSKSKANGSATKAKPGTSKAEESEVTPKGKSSGAMTKAQESEPKSGSKRRRK